MNIRNTVLRLPHAPPVLDAEGSRLNDAQPHRGGHGWLMALMCLPMLAIGIVLVATGVVGGSFLFLGIGCFAMMMLMMRGMDHGGMNHGGDRSDHQGPPPPPPPVR